MSRFLLKPKNLEQNGCIHQITPASAGWEYVGFDVYKLEAGKKIHQETGDQEVCLVIVAGKASISTRSKSWENIGSRTSPFEEEPPFAVYVPPGDHYEITATSTLELAVCRAPAEGKYPARLIAPSDTVSEIRGVGNNQRQVCNILFSNVVAERLLVCEVKTPSGNWSSYPPHKHDQEAKPHETRLEETYYHRINPPQGFVFQRVYTDDRSIDESFAVDNECVVLVPKGYHPVGVPHGYDSYYLNCMAGPERAWIFHNDPDHEWIITADAKK